MFRNDGGSLPYLIFYVDPVPVPDDPGVVATPSPLPVPTLDPENDDSQGFTLDSRKEMVGRSVLGWSYNITINEKEKNVVRQHMMML